MTAVVGILNKHAIAIAADSAVTITGVKGRKIFNGANKIFTLSKHCPIGVMVYNSADLMGTPWEVIIKLYRQKLGKKSFKTLKEYQEDFMNFLKRKDYFVDDEMKSIFLVGFVNHVLDSFTNSALKKFKPKSQQLDSKSKKEIIKLIQEEIPKWPTKTDPASSKCPDFINYTYRSFVANSGKIVKGAIKDKFAEVGIVIDTKTINKLSKILYNIILNGQQSSGYTGLIFVGYGEDEIYPSLIPVNISFAIKNRLWYYVDETRIASISNMNSGAIRPFAQTDVINTILTGTDPTLENIYLRNIVIFIGKYNELLKNKVNDPNVNKIIDSIIVAEPLRELMQRMDQVRKEKYINPLMDAVSTLSKEDLVEMAESLIYLTYLKRRITFAEESVGGPVDVAVISKGDGFIWIKRKHYFDKELNHQFISKYFNI